MVTHTTFQELLLTPFNVHEILGFEMLSSEKHFCHCEISEILLRLRGLDPWIPSLYGRKVVGLIWIRFDFCSVALELLWFFRRTAALFRQIRTFPQLFRFCSDLGNSGIRQIVRNSMLGSLMGRTNLDKSVW